MSEEKITALEHRVTALEKRVNDDLWVTNLSFIKRTLSIYGHSLLGGIIFSAAFCLFIGAIVLMFAVIAGIASN